jgi:hypothetical protein
MAVLGDTLYFVSDDGLLDDAGATGGFYSCDLTKPAPCTPTLIAPAESPAALSITTDGKIYYTDARDPAPGGIMQYAPGSQPTVFRSDFGFVPKLYVSAGRAYYGVTLLFADPQYAVFFEALTDGGVTEVGRYTKKDQASEGLIIGAGDALFYSAYDYQSSTGGKVSRISVPGSVGVAACDFGGTTNKRPYGLFVDTTNLYWTNQGDPDAPWDNGTIATCALDGCCATPNVLWTGSGEPVAIVGDATGLYWATYRSGQIWKVAKP